MYLHTDYQPETCPIQAIAFLLMRVL